MAFMYAVWLGGDSRKGWKWWLENGGRRDSWELGGAFVALCAWGRLQL